ncbi:CHAP domain-containing protein [Ichthyenterobacterium sp. W332]|uniref:CHAP domain-containing protein n=1 Tax=Microcosmobacter mediterraneus TaxID=3075607 RepID=A0ABU2YGY5_9FLAO|nr:CHAP domain-containing protein [Ichthyenterobacterium sp. W332]MDT0557438.1 CHAP domain-containing protein [Ichthyenterobacterium sp. W332]
MKGLAIYFGLLFLVLSCKDNTSKKYSSPNRKVLSNSKSKENPVPFKVSKIGDTLDVFNGVYVIYNKSISNTSGRHLTKDGYNLGLKWQCVEFVKRYYFEHLNHKMSNSYGHAKDFYNANLSDGSINSDRNLMQFSNRSKTKPKVNDLLIFDGNIFNKFGHVAIISKVSEDTIEIVQQNVGKHSRDTIDLEFKDNKWYLDDSEILGWLRKN